MKKISTTVEQYTTVYHIEHGKGQVVSLTPKMTKREIDKLMNKDADPLQSALNNLFGGGR
mgnify:CR=1 FL=1